MTRVATPRNEGTLLNVALHGTAHHIEKMVRNYRRGKRLEALNEENRRHALRELTWYVGDDGCWVFKGRFSPEQGALIAKALEKAMDEQFAELRDEHPDVSAATPKGGVDEWQLPHPIATRRADALERLAEAFLADSEKASSGGDRYLVNIHTEAEVLQADGTGAQSECEDDGHVTAETSRRLPASADGRYCGNAVLIKVQNRNNGIDIDAKALPPHWGGEMMDYDYAQSLLQQWE